MAFRLSTQEETENKRKIIRRSMIVETLLIALLIFIGLFLLPNDTQKDLFSWEEDGLVLHMSEESVYTVPYQDITQMTLISDAEIGTCVSGDSEGNTIHGIWRNDTLGEYVLCTYRERSTMIQITIPGEVYWIAYESEDTTTALYQSLVKTLTEQGYTFFHQ